MDKLSARVKISSTGINLYLGVKLLYCKEKNVSLQSIKDE